jgi:hypothetical protein
MPDKKYMVTGAVTISVHTVVTASSAKEAKRKAMELPMGSIHHDTHQDPVDDDGYSWSEWRTSGEIDGEAADLSAEEYDDD